jgi:hypothetical protein
MYIRVNGTTVGPLGSGSGSGSGGASISANPPSSPTLGQIWFNSLNGKTYVYYDSFWIEIGGTSSGSIISTDVALSNSWWLGV